MLKTVISGAALMIATASTAFADTDGRHDAWGELLDTYVVENADGVNRFNYGGLKASDDDRAKLDTYLATFADLDFDTLSQDEQFAAYSNIYNALTVKHITERYPVKSIRSGYLIGPWKRVKTEIDGELQSLDAIEHKILRPMSDARVHYVINCAAWGCPNLRAEPITAEGLDETLDEAARDYVNHPRGVSIRANGGLQVSTIYKWFQEDFGDSKQDVVDHLLEYAEPELAEQIKSNARIRNYAYDWALNDAPDGTS